MHLPAHNKASLIPRLPVYRRWLAYSSPVPWPIPHFVFFKLQSTDAEETVHCNKMQDLHKREGPVSLTSQTLKIMSG